MGGKINFKHMKKATCADIGGPKTCTETFTAETPEKMIDQAWKHLQKDHPEMAKNIMSNSKEENDKWMNGFKANTFPNLPEA